MLHKMLLAMFSKSKILDLFEEQESSINAPTNPDEIEEKIVALICSKLDFAILTENDEIEVQKHVIDTIYSDQY
ncbi:hypothetical protein [Thaumasiovibrio sp. DFM-14]|uniref:hypothetical protein n=1 Tax=Thaumasiovibrio sp. DFM-14 TaxID=3384792 RepID=UPI0039A2A220